MPTEFLSGIVPRLPFTSTNIALIDGAGQFTSGGTLNLFIQGRNRAGYTLPSTAIAPITYGATQAVQISFPDGARTNGTDYHYYTISHSPTGNPADAIALFSWRNYEVDQITLRPLNPILLLRNSHIEIAPNVSTPNDLPTGANLLPGMMRLVVGGVRSSAYYQYEELETRIADDQNLVLQPHGIEKWVRTGSPNVGVINSIYGGNGCSQAVQVVGDEALPPEPYRADGTKGTPTKLIFRNDSGQALPRGTAFLLQVELEGAPSSQLFDGKLMLTPRGFVNLDNGAVDISDGIGGEMPDIGGDIPWTFGSRSTLFLYKDLPAGFAYYVEIAPFFSVAQLEGKILEGAKIAVNIVPAAQSGENAYAIWQLTGNIVFADGGKLRVVPGIGLNAKLLSGSALIERFTFPSRGNRDLYGVQPNVANQRITIDGNGAMFYRGVSSVIPGTEAIRAKVSAATGFSLSSISNFITVGANGGLAVTLDYPCDSDGFGTIRSDYPFLADSTEGLFNPPYVGLFVLKQSTNTIYQLPNLVAVVPGFTQSVVISSLDTASVITSVPEPQSSDYCLFDPPDVSIIAGAGSLETDSYQVIAAYYFDGSVISSISHSPDRGCINEVQGTLNDLFTIRSDLDLHIANQDNPHAVNAGDVGNANAVWNANKLQSRSVLSTAPTDEQPLLWNAGLVAWQPGVFSRLLLKPSVAPRTGTGEVAIFADINDNNALKVRSPNNGEVKLIGSILNNTTEDDDMASWLIKTSNYTAVAKDKIAADTTTVFTITMPEVPAIGDEIKLANVGTDPLNIAFGSTPYKGYSPISTAFIDLKNEEVSLVYVSATKGWVPTKNSVIIATIEGTGGSGGGTTTTNV